MVLKNKNLNSMADITTRCSPHILLKKSIWIKAEELIFPMVDRNKRNAALEKYSSPESHRWTKWKI